MMMPTKKRSASRVKRARNAYSKKDVKSAKKAHTKKAIKDHLSHEHNHESSGRFVGEIVYGAIDGAITTFAVVAGVTGAALSPAIVIILGIANLVADGFSMACSNYLSERANRDFIRRERNREIWEVKHMPAAEREEIRQIMKKKGLKGKTLEKAVSAITSNKKVWVDTMMSEELGLVESDKQPLQTATMTFFGFITIGLIPLLSYLLAIWFPLFRAHTFFIACVMTFVALFIVGAIKRFVTKKNLWWSAFETVSVGGIAAVIAYSIGHILRVFVGV